MYRSIYNTCTAGISWLPIVCRNEMKLIVSISWRHNCIYTYTYIHTHIHTHKTAAFSKSFIIIDSISHFVQFHVKLQWNNRLTYCWHTYIHTYIRTYIDPAHVYKCTMFCFQLATLWMWRLALLVLSVLLLLQTTPAAQSEYSSQPHFTRQFVGCLRNCSFSLPSTQQPALCPALAASNPTTGTVTPLCFCKIRF